jgi:hypothetical protein
MLSLLAQAQDLKVEAKSAGPQQATKVMTIDIDALEAFAGACEAQFPELSLNENAIKNGGLADRRHYGAVCGHSEVPQWLRDRVLQRQGCPCWRIDRVEVARLVRVIILLWASS